jgi:D-alanyl-D-alanine carboxypeptidase/D-alanyl-D-alanine-endopeptidase (penicillin-binding protein 4)
LYNTKPAFYSYIAGSVNSSKVDDQYFAQVYTSPASCQKVVTSLLALKDLGAQYHYKTELFIAKKGHQIKDVVIKFVGDPTLTSDQLIAALKPLKNRQITGHIILDASLFKTSLYSRNLMIDDIATNYATPVCAANLDKNLIAVTLWPTALGQLAKGYIDSGYSLDSKVVTNDQDTCVKLVWIDGVIHASGNINVNESFKSNKIAPICKDYYLLNKMQQILQHLNIKAKIKIARKQSFDISAMEHFSDIQSEQLGQMIKPQLKISNNLFFDSLYLTLIDKHAQEAIKEWAQGSNIFKQLLKKHFSLDTQDSLFVDGSGLSRYNRMQPTLLFALLKKGFIIPEFVDALASPGEEHSTLAKRSNLLSTIRAKTGGMTSISCLCGYHLKLKDPQAFVFISNSFAPPTQKTHDVIDEFINANMNKF